jgi:hypothetical protein
MFSTQKFFGHTLNLIFNFFNISIDIGVFTVLLSKII